MNNIVYDVVEGFRFIDFNLGDLYGEERDMKYLEHYSIEYYMFSSLYAPPEHKAYAHFVR